MDRATRREQRLQQLDEQAARIRAEKRRLKALASQEERKQETRRLILRGVVVREALKAGDVTEAGFLKLADKHLLRERDRELFGLPPRQGSEKGAAQP